MAVRPGCGVAECEAPCIGSLKRRNFSADCTVECILATGALRSGSRPRSTLTEHHPGKTRGEHAEIARSVHHLERQARQIALGASGVCTLKGGNTESAPPLNGCVWGGVYWPGLRSKVRSMREKAFGISHEAFIHRCGGAASGQASYESMRNVASPQTRTSLCCVQGCVQPQRQNFSPVVANNFG